MPRALYIGFVWPEPTSSAAGVRAWDLLKALLAAGYEVDFLSPSPENDFTAQLRAAGIRTKSLGPNDSAFDSFVSALDPDVVILDRFMIEEQFGWRIREHSPRTLRVLDTIDLHFLRRAREAALARGESLENIFGARFDFGSPESPGHEDALRELAAIYRSDLTLILSDFEKDLLRSRFAIPDFLLELSPFFVPAPDRASPGFGSRKHFVSIGNFRHAPNADSARYAKEAIWPELRKRLPDAQYHFYGAYPSREIMALSDPKNGFVIQGPAKDAVATLKNYRVNLAPLRFGAGIKGKIADGWRAGLPAVTTPIGAEGMTLSDGTFGGAVARTPEDLVEQCVRLYTDEASWATAREKGFETLSALFDEKRGASRFVDAIECARREIEARRARNFTGSMLSHHFHKSTTYLSRWIEAKNRLPRA